MPKYDRELIARMLSCYDGGGYTNEAVAEQIHLLCEAENLEVDARTVVRGVSDDVKVMTMELQQPNQNKEDPKYLYRYFDEMSNEGEYLYNACVRVRLERYRVDKVTPQGAWIFDHNSRRRWVSTSTRKAYAFETQEKALKSFLARKRRQLNFKIQELSRVIAVLDLATSGQLDSNANCRHPISGTFHALKKAAKYTPSINNFLSPN